MKTPRIANAVEFIGDNLITAAADSGKKKTKSMPWLKWGSVAACLAVIAVAAAAIVPSFLDRNTVSPQKYKYQISGSETDMIWAWEYMTNGEKYQTVNFKGKKYSVKSTNPISEDLLGEVLGSCEAEGTDYLTGKNYSKTVEVRKISGVAEEKLIAYGAEGEFYVCALNDTAKPQTLGELTELYGLAQTLKLNRFSVREGYEEKEYRSVKDDAYIWQILSECQDAKLCGEIDSFDLSNRSCLSFTATSDSLGVYKRVIYISQDGYFATNIFDYSYIYFIGEDAAEKIISYATSNSTQTSFEPYELTIPGTLTEVGDGYVLIDDSAFCADEKDGVVYKVLTGDIRMERSIIFGIVKVGDTVAVKYRGEISDNNQISGAYSIYKGTLIDGDLAIQE